MPPRRRRLRVVRHGRLTHSMISPSGPRITRICQYVAPSGVSPHALGLSMGSPILLHPSGKLFAQRWVAAVAAPALGAENCRWLVIGLIQVELLAV
jgi:hypothetical protein